MKRLAGFILIACCITTLVGCGRGEEVNGRNMKTVFKSMKGLKNRLPNEKRIEFEVSFWMIRDSAKAESDFLNAVDGKKPEQIIALGREIYQQRKNSGVKEYTQYNSWEQMIEAFGKERVDQENMKGRKKEDPRDKANNVLYDLNMPSK